MLDHSFAETETLQEHPNTGSKDSRDPVTGPPTVSGHGSLLSVDPRMNLPVLSFRAKEKSLK
jgi:hypothetical protein